MNRVQKTEVIDLLKNEFSKSQAAFVVGYKGLTVKQMQALRKELRVNKGTLKVAKGRLMKRAVQDVDGINDLAPYFRDQIGIVFASDGAPAVAKVLHNFSKQNEALRLIGGFFDARILPSEAISRIATLPPREVLLAQLCGVLKAPTTRLVSVLNMQMVQLVYVLKKIADQKQQ